MKRLVFALALSTATVVPLAAEAGPVSGQKWVLEIDGAATGTVHDVGPLGYSRVVDGQVVASATPMAVDIEMDLSSRKQLAWVAAFLSGSGGARTLEIGDADIDFKLRRTYEIPDFAIRELHVPACDANEQDPAFLRVRGRGSRITRSAASGQVEGLFTKETSWTQRSFDTRVSGIDHPKVALIGPIDVSRSAAGLVIAPIDIVALGSGQIDLWHAWGEKVLVRGEADERTIEIDLKTKDNAKVLATLRLTGVSPIEMRYGDGPMSSSPSSTFRVTAKGISLVLPKLQKGKPPKG